MPFALWSDGTGGWERCSLVFDDAVGGHIVGNVHGAAKAVAYRVDLAETWAASALTVNDRHLVREPDGQWARDGHPIDAVRGCLDVDLGFTPGPLAATLRRLELAPGERTKVTVLRLDEPLGEPRALVMHVAHLTEHDWLIERDGQPSRVHLGAQGLVVEDERGWSALATA